MKVYLCARYGRVHEMRAIATELTARGFVCASRWVWIDSVEETMSLADRGDLADQCLEDIRSADLVLAFTEAPGSPYGRGGRHVELGVAIALLKPVVVVGPVENIFCALPWVMRCADPATVWAFLKGAVA